jgi:trigger factor
VLADLALRAVVAQEEISATDDELTSEIARIAERAEQKPEKVRRELERSGALEAVRSEIARGKALEFLVEHAKVVDEEGNEIDLTIPDEAPEVEVSDEREQQDVEQEEEAADA